MIKRLQNFNFKFNPYVRSQDEWVCGWAAEGKPCHRGPGPNGVCQTQSECQPVKNGDRWICTRPVSAGGTCATGPLPNGECCHQIIPCVPRARLRNRRRRFVIWCITLLVGLFTVALSGPYVNAIVSPGDLSSHHTEVGGCETCHDAVGKGLGVWVDSIFSLKPASQASAPCLNCHNVGKAPLKAHGVLPAKLAAIESAEVSSGMMSSAMRLSRTIFDKPHQTVNDISCSTCHSEHKGHDYKVATMTNNRCQSCHKSAFGSFSDGHPPFADYPYTRRGRLVFDHVRHIDRHFPESKISKKPDQCLDCHELRDGGRKMRVTSYEQMCGQCHAEDVSGKSHAGIKGIPFFEVPGLDLQTLADRGYGIGTWPSLADAPLNAFVEHLLMRDEESKKLLKALRGVDLMDLREANVDTLEKIEAFAWLFKSFLNRAVASGGFIEPIGDNAPQDETRISRLLAGLPRDSLKLAVGSWFTNLEDDLAKHDKGKNVPIPGFEKKIRMNKTAAPAKKENASSLVQSDILGSAEQSDILDKRDQSDILGSSKKADADLSGEQSDILGSAEQSDILDKVDQSDILGSSRKADADLSGEQSDILGNDAQAGILSGSENLNERPKANAPFTIEPKKKPVTVHLEPDVWAKYGGWFRAEFAMYYRPTEHQDRFIQTWIDSLGTQLASSEVGGADEKLFNRLTDPAAIGKCGKCHSVDKKGNGELVMNWRFAPSHEKQRAFTKFSHTKHFSLVQEPACVTCHSLNKSADYLSAYKHRDPALFQSNFAPLKINGCQDCHLTERAGDNCSMCHNYHADDVSIKVAPGRLEATANKH